MRGAPASVASRHAWPPLRQVQSSEVQRRRRSAREVASEPLAWLRAVTRTATTQSSDVMHVGETRTQQAPAAADKPCCRAVREVRAGHQSSTPNARPSAVAMGPMRCDTASLAAAIARLTRSITADACACSQEAEHVASIALHRRVAACRGLL